MYFSFIYMNKLQKCYFEILWSFGHSTLSFFNFLEHNMLLFPFLFSSF